MSNVIKGYAIRYEDSGIKTIDTNLRISQELLLKTNFQMSDQAEGNSEELSFDKIDAKSREIVAEFCNRLLKEAKEEADRILLKAKKEAEQMKSEAYTEAKNNGYADGIAQGNKQILKLKSECQEEEKRLRNEYEAKVRELEPCMVDIIADMITRLTGILTKDNKDVIRFLVARAINRMDRSDEYLVKVSGEDYDYIESRIDDILNSLSSKSRIKIVAAPNLVKNQCLIETDSQVIDCSLDVQLNNLMTDLRLLSGI